MLAWPKMSPLARTRIASRAQWGRPLHLVEGSMGGHGLAPLHPNHHFELVEGVDRGDGYQGYWAVSAAYAKLLELGLDECAEHLDSLTGIAAWPEPSPLGL